jgi:hypothetical protein
MTADPEPETENQTTPPAEEETEVETYCARHPNVSTTLACGRCGTPICPRCLVQTPVGARCPTCANVRRLPTVDVKPVFLVRGLAAAIGAGIVVGGFWGLALPARSTGVLGFFVFFLAMGIGYAIGEAIGAATNRKRSTALQGCAIFGAVLASLVHNVVSGSVLLPQGDLFGYLAMIGAAFFAAQRLQG